MAPSSRLSPQDWIDEALAMIADVGVEGLAVEPLAKRLGTTKGSFYWHFDSRAALLDAVLAFWLEAGTQRVIDASDGQPPEERLRDVLRRAFGTPHYDGAEGRLLTSRDPRVAKAAATVHAARRDYLRSLLSGMGLPPDVANRRARIIYATYIGHIHLTHSTAPGTQPTPTTQALIDELTTMANAQP